MIVSPGSALPSTLFAVGVNVAGLVMTAVTDPTVGANGSGAGAGCGPGSAGAGTAVGGLTKRLSVATFFARSSDF